MLNIIFWFKKCFQGDASSSDNLNKKIKQVNQDGKQRARVEENKLNNLPFHLQKIILGEVLIDPGADCEEYFFKNLAEFKLLSKKFNSEFSKNLWDASAKDQVWHAASAPGVAGKLSEQCIDRELRKGLPEAELRKNLLKIMKFFPHIRIRLSPKMLNRHRKILLDLMLNEAFLEQNKFELIASDEPGVISSIIQKLMSSKTLVESGRLIGLNLTSTLPLESPDLPILNPVCLLSHKNLSPLNLNSDSPLGRARLPILDPVWLLSHKNLKTLNLKQIELRKSSRELEVQPDQPIGLENVDLLDCVMVQDVATCFAKCEALVSFKISRVVVSEVLFLGLAEMKNLKTLFMTGCFFNWIDYQVCHQVNHGFSSLNFLNVNASLFCARAMNVMFRGAALKHINALIFRVFDNNPGDVKTSEALFNEKSEALFNENIVAILADDGLKYLEFFHMFGIKITQSCLSGLSKLKHFEKLISTVPDTIEVDEIKGFIEKSENLKSLMINYYKDLDPASRTELFSWSTRLRPGFELYFYGH
ncbi:hypothetical protein [Paraburkholderia hayleyella]|uniref:hypothetical protein n=1 Tax=Paraburkholderia hayleyella TaxID=2152889 RepID=UPI001292B4F8|nr:hypothetical protein [Paraburkholderia hayleyella]